MTAIYDPATGVYMGEAPDEQQQITDRLRRDWIPDTKKVIQENIMTSPGQAGRLLAAGAAQIPTQLAGITELARTVPSFTNHFAKRAIQDFSNQDDPEAGVWDRLKRIEYGKAASKALADTSFDKYGDNILFGYSGDSDKETAAIQDEVQKQFNANPNMSKKEIDEAFRAATQKRLYPNARMFDQYNRWTEDLVGAKHAEDRNFGENFLLNAGPALVPASKLSKIPAWIDPRTTNYTLGGITLNGGIGGTLGAVLNENHPHQIDPEPHTPKPITADATLLQQPDYIRTPEGNPVVSVNVAPETEEESKSNTQKGYETAAYITPAIGLGLLGIAFKRNSAPAVTQALIKPGMSAFEEMAARGAGGVVHAGPPNARTHKPGSITETVKHQLDEFTPVTSAIEEAHQVKNPTTGKMESTLQRGESVDMTTAQTEHARHNVSMKVDQHRASGLLDGKQTISIKNLDDQRTNIRNTYGDQGVQALDTYIAASQREADVKRMNYEYTTERDNLAAYNRQLHQELAQPNLPIKKQSKILEEIADNQAKIDKYNDNLNKIAQDLEESRPSLRDLDRSTVEKYIKEGDSKPEFKAYKQSLRQLADDHLEYMVNNKTLSRAKADELKQHGYVTPWMNDEYIGKNGRPAKGLERKWLQIKDRMMSLNENKYGDPGVKMYGGDSGDANVARAMGPLRSKDFEIGKENAVNNPINSRDAWDLYMERTIRYNERIKLQRNTMDAITAGPNWSSVVDHITPAHKNPLFTRDELKVYLKDGMPLHGMRNDILIIPRGDDTYQVFRPKDKLLYLTMQQYPLINVPILTPMMNAFKMATTGILRPAFATKSFAYDTRTINAARPYGSVSGTDAIVSRMGNLFGYTLPDSAAHAIRMAMTNYDPAAWVLGIQAALIGYTRQNQLRIGRKFTDTLTSNSPVFNAMVNSIPGMRPVMEKIGKDWVQSYSDSMYHALTSSHVANNFELQHMFRTTREVERLMDVNIPRWMQVMGTPATEMVHQYRMMMSSIESAARVSYAMQNIQREAVRAGHHDWTKLSDKTINKIMRDARTLGGDFARKPGGQVMQTLDATVPYVNVMIQTTAAIHRRVMTNPALLATAFAGITVPYVLSEMLMNNWDDEARKWRFDKTPDFKRVSTIVMPTFETMMEWAKTGKLPAFTPDKVYQFTVVPEFRVYSAPISEAIRALGGYGPNPKTLGKHPDAETTTTLLAESLKQAYGIGGPPILNAALGQAFPNAKFDLGGLYNILPRMFGADADNNKINVFQQPAWAQSRQSGDTPMNLTSGMPKWWSEVVSSLFGANAANGLQAFDTGAQVYEKNGKNLADAVIAGLGEIGRREAVYARGEDAPGLWSATEKVYRNTPVKEEIDSFRKLLGQISGREAKLTKPVGDPVLDGIAQQLRWAARDPRVTRMSQEYRMLTDQINKLEANRMIPYDKREEAKIPYLKKIQVLNEQQLAFMRETQERYTQRFNERYRQAYGVPFSYQDFIKRLSEADRKKRAGL